MNSPSVMSWVVFVMMRMVSGRSVERQRSKLVA